MMNLHKLVSAKRQTYDIYADILTQALKPSRKTRIMYKSNLGYNQLMKYLSTLLEKGFIEIKYNPHRVFQTTEEGKEWLHVYQQLTILLRMK